MFLRVYNIVHGCGIRERVVCEFEGSNIKENQKRDLLLSSCSDIMDIKKDTCDNMRKVAATDVDG